MYKLNLCGQIFEAHIITPGHPFLVHFKIGLNKSPLLTLSCLSVNITLKFKNRIQGNVRNDNCIKRS